MSSNSVSTRMASVLLRATLAIIFIWHGLEKLTSPYSSWGANWANRLWQQGAEPPPEVFTKLAGLPPRAWLTEKEFVTEMKLDEIKELAGLRLHETRSRIHRAYATNPDPLSPVFSHAVQYAVTWGELLGGFALLIGLLTRAAAVGLILIQLGAIYFVTSPLGLFQPQGVGFEYNICLVVMCLAVILLGAGGWSVDYLLGWDRGRAKKPQAAPTPAPVPASVSA